jgi:uncharacterized surface protein with fasciclin (FAS1) repeats
MTFRFSGHAAPALAFAVFVLAGCAATPPTPPAPVTIADTAARAPQLSTLNRLIDESGLAATLQGSGPYTLFAPSDEAFSKLPPATLAALEQDKEKLRALLSYHLVAGELRAADVKNGNAKSLQGGELALAKAGTFLTVEDALVVQPDQVSSNGVVHIIDRVLTPPKPR